MDELGKSGADARYVYALIPKMDRYDFGPIGIAGSRVYCVPYRDIGALVHDCPPKPYQGDFEAVEGWVRAHNEVVDAVWAEAGSVLPMRFDVIVRPSEERSADENLRAWLEERYDSLKVKLEELRGKVELGVQVLWDTVAVAQEIIETRGEIRALAAEMAEKSRGLTYFHQHKISKALKQALEQKAEADFRAHYARLANYAEDIQVNHPKKQENKQMIMNLSLLVGSARVGALSEALAEIEEEGVEVRCTGPWPPYTFAAKIAAVGDATTVELVD